MSSLRSIFQSILLLALCATVYPSSVWCKRDGPYGKGPSTAKAVYVMTNDVIGNAIVAMSVGYKGQLSGGSITPTGGRGSNLINANGQIAFPDALSVQDSVVSVGNASQDYPSPEYLFAVNAGSNTLSMFAVSTSNPVDVTLLGQPQNTNGGFPVAVAVSTALKMACVVNNGIPSGVSCATFSEQGLSAFDTLRPMYLGATQNPPLGPVPGVGDIFFTEDQSSLIVMVKGGPPTAPFTGYVAQFAVQNGAVATAVTITTPPKSQALFGTALVPGLPNVVFTSDAGFGALTLNINDLAAAPIAVVNVTGQLASCWAQVSTLTGTGFITDVAINRLVEADIKTGAIVTEYYPPNPFSGMSDFKIVGGYLWSLSAGNGSVPASITTFDITGGPGTVKQVSYYAIPGAGVNTMGLVTL